MVSLNNGSKYYVKGIRESGKGTDEVSETGGSERVAAFTVDRDQDYVVAYGVLTNPVEYTVRYQTADGRELAPSETYYGNIGDRPVIAYQYIEGYQPQAYNLTKTLSKDQAENVFTFIYSPLPENTVYTNTTTTVVSGTTPTTPPDNTSSTSEEGSDRLRTKLTWMTILCPWPILREAWKSLTLMERCSGTTSHLRRR